MILKSIPCISMELRAFWKLGNYLELQSHYPNNSCVCYDILHIIAKQTSSLEYSSIQIGKTVAAGFLKPVPRLWSKTVQPSSEWFEKLERRDFFLPSRKSYRYRPSMFRAHNATGAINMSEACNYACKKTSVWIFCSLFTTAFSISQGCSFSSEFDRCVWRNGMNWPRLIM